MLTCKKIRRYNEFSVKSQSSSMREQMKIAKSSARTTVWKNLKDVAVNYEGLKEIYKKLAG